MIRRITKRYMCTYADILGTQAFLPNSDTIHPGVYSNKKVYSSEMKKMYEGHWVVVGFTDQLRNNNIIQTHVHRIPLIITKDKEQNIRGFYNVCRHRGSMLVSEHKNSSRIVCPYHKWTYGLDGQLLGTPMCKIDKEHYPLYSV